MTKAYLLARAFDVVPDVVYQWRIRDDRTSISQQKAETRDLVDKLAGQREVAEFLHARASPEVLHRWYAKTLRHDFLSYSRSPRTPRTPTGRCCRRASCRSPGRRPRT